MNNTLWALSERGIQILFGLIPFILIARFFDKKDIAMYSIVSMLLFNLWSLSSFNSRSIYIKYKSLYGEAFKRRFLVVFFVNKLIVFFVFSGFLFLYLDSLSYLNIYVVSSFFVFLFNIFETSLWDVECDYKQRKVFIFRFIVSLLSFFAKIFVILYIESIEVMFLVLAFEMLAFQLLFYIFREDKAQRIFIFKFRNWLYFTKKTFPLFVSGLIVFAYNRIDQLMLASLASAEQLADYSVVLKLVEPLSVIPTAICATALPFLVGLKRNKSKYIDVLKGYICMTFYASLFLSLFFIFFGADVVTIMFGEKYVNITSLVFILAMSIPFSFIAVFNGMLLVFYDRQSLAPVRALFGLVVNVLLNFIFIPAYGALGAALATLFTLILSGVVLYLVLPSTRNIGILNLLSPFYVKKIKLIKL
ncbi:hypothetical protein EKG38_24150 [Shewanella canadensis]|uniref:Uncharacterized protein n=1 Tax=Shewanella canadensis TaxID=271096 RepID=A0A431WK28_9GAMM|nr:polysaccharide biosynthesis C-terminal domain-containing protein [Shewanella canadensis]RTR35968.1 hypothetical protein EKG38_24150 [Shewanella canadensis]